MIDFNHGVRLTRIPSHMRDTLYDWRNDYRIWRWCRQNDLLTRQKHEHWFDHEMDLENMYAVVGNDVYLGVCGFTGQSGVNRRSEFSLYIDPLEHGKGWGRKALLTLFDHGFRNLGLHSIWGEAFAHNPARRLFESIGMTMEGIRRDFYFREGQFCDAILYSLLDREWLSR